MDLRIPSGIGVDELLKDMGDGTYARVVSVASTGGGGAPATMADGADVTQGAKADAAATSDTGAFSLIALVKRGLQNWTTLLARFPAFTQSWSYAAAAGGIVDTTAVAMKTAAGAGVRNYLTGASIQNASATVDTEVLLLDGVTAIARFFVGAGQSVTVTFPSPLKSSANAALNVQCVTTAAQVYANAQGFVAP
ncbi:hypothetical protein [Variovorax sp. DXTD-1]|uniref:hypothetical protein n=1 Tax=Variovorax sp. DXTD-1 TaxID=2495592 RepID=UPI000F85CE3E|nr:hypothetical protein [Variovorax sp. DXTD-1]RST54093.1 hypothetical protein EJI00_02910 [Variovorax sp. DXTD-1]